MEIKRIYSGSTRILDRSDLHVMDDKSRIAIVNRWTADNQQREINSSGELNQNRFRYQYGNHLGSASLELDKNAQIISYEEYFPYGGTSFVAGQNQKEVKLKEYRYTGKERDGFTSLYYYGARYYAPWLGRWLSADPAGSKDSINLYCFVKGNPIRFNDVDGKQSADEVIGNVEKRFNVDLPNVDQIKSFNYTRNTDEEGNIISETYNCISKSGDVFAGRTEYSAMSGLVSLASAAAEKFIWEHPFSSKGAPGTFRGKILENMYGVPWRSNTPKIDIITETEVQQVKSTKDLKNVGNITRSATRDAAQYIKNNPNTTAGKQPKAVIITETGIPKSASQEIATALDPVNGRKIPPNAAAPKHIRGLPGTLGAVGKGLTVAGTVLSGYATYTDIKEKDYSMAIGHGLMAGGGAAEICAIAFASKAAMSGGLVTGGVGLSIASGISSYRSFKSGDTTGGVVDLVGVAAGLAIAGGVIAGAPVVLAIGAVAALGVGAFHLYRWLSK